MIRNRERSQQIFRRQQHFDLQKQKEEKEERKIIIKQIRNPQKRKDQIVSNSQASEHGSNRNDLSYVEVSDEGDSKSRGRKEPLVFKSAITSQAEKNQARMQQRAKVQNVQYQRKMELQKKNVMKNIEKMKKLQ